MIKKRSFGLYLLLTFITFGIYGIIFMYKYNEDVNVICEGVDKPNKNYIVVILLTLVTCGIYYYVWIYKIGNRLNQQGFNWGINMTESGTTLVLWSTLGSLLCGVGPLVAQYMMVKNFNIIAEAYNNK